MVIGTWCYLGKRDMSTARVIQQKLLEEWQEMRYRKIHGINRTFLGCTLGETVQNVRSKLDKKGIAYSMKSVHKRNILLIKKIEYGKYDLDSLVFGFYRNKLYKAQLYFHIASYEDFNNDATYRHFAKFLKEKYWSDYGVMGYTNCYQNSITQVSLWTNKSNNYSSYVVRLTYYDRTSGSEQNYNQGF